MRAVMEHVDLNVDAGIARFKSNDVAVKKFVGVSDLDAEKVNPIEISKSLGFTDHADLPPNNEAAWSAPASFRPP